MFIFLLMFLPMSHYTEKVKLTVSEEILDEMLLACERVNVE